jgi:NAD(P)-dependent dehydrogenase (short-subunit alcohol dehydrogenase family)/3-oxoacyl-(acyl-carrier-protein) synthase
VSSANEPFRGRVVLVTGGARGVGRAISTAFARLGAHVIVNYFHATDEASALLAELREAGHSAEPIRASVAMQTQVNAMFDTVTERHGRLDVLVNNAAAGALLPLSELDESHWRRALDTNLRGSLWCSRRAAALMRDGSAIVNLSSLGSTMVINDYLTVGTSKAAVESLTRYLAVEFAPTGIRVNTASGGLVDGSVAGLFPRADQLAAQVKAATPLGHRLGTEEELAELVVFLASPQSSWITGQNVVADGGLSLGSFLLSPAAPNPDAAEPQGHPDDIAIVGMGVVTPGANTPEELWRVLNGSEHVFTEPAGFDIDSFQSDDPDVEDRTYTRRSGFITRFEPHPALRAELDAGTAPCVESTTLWLRHSLLQALEGVGRTAEDRYFASFGYTADGSQDLEEHLVLSGYTRRLGFDPEERLAKRYLRPYAPASEFLPHRVGRNAFRGLLPEQTEVVMVDTACSSSLYAIDLGVKALREGTCDTAVCGGAFAYSARNLVLFSKLRGLSRTGEVRSFDRDASGVLFSDGAGAIVLKKLSRARADGDRVLGVIDSVGLSCDGRGKAIYAPNPAGQVHALRRAYDKSEVDPATVRWVVAHATGTQAGDSTEVATLEQVLGAGPPALLSSNKPVVGHTGWTAGVVSVVQVLSGLARGVVPAQAYLRNPLPSLENSRFTPPVTATPLPSGTPRRAAISSFGFGGTNAHLVLSDQPHGTVNSPSPTDDEVVVVDWAADVPGDATDVLGWLRGTAAAPPPGFGDEYPLPGFDEVRLPPTTLRNMDRTQIMLLRAAARLDAEVRDVCTELRDTTGVIVGHMGPTRRAVHYALRCYLGDLRAVLHDDEAAVQRVADAVRALVPPSTEDAFPGIMPNIIPARLASLWDFHGLNSTVDDGPDSGLTAIRCAERYLRHGDLDLALVAGVSGNTTPEFVDVLATAGPRTDVVGEGAFIAVLARKATAQARGLPFLATISTALGSSDVDSRARRVTPLNDCGRTYLGADGMVALLARLVGPGGRATVASTADWGPQVTIDVERSETGIGTPSMPASGYPVRRMVSRLEPAAPRPASAEIAALPSQTLLLVDDEKLLPELAPPAGVLAVVANGEPADLPEPAFTVRHVRVVADLGASDEAADHAGTPDRLRPLHDLAYLAAQRWTAQAGDSFGVILLDSVRGDVAHPAAGPFTGLVKSLAREHDAAFALAVLTDATSPGRALDVWRGESAHDHEFAVVAHSRGRRLVPTLVDAELPARRRDPLPSGAVIVAAGGSRGLTAELLCGLAARVAPTIYLLGRNAPGREDVPERSVFLAEARRTSPNRPIAEVIAEHDRLRAQAHTARTIRRLADSCGADRVHHLVCDLTDPVAVGRAADTILSAHPRVELLINAAGLHRGGSVRTTTLEQARAVRDTKLLAHLNLSRAFAGRRPHRWINFGSLLAVLGWAGEADYCSGNDLLNHAAAWQTEFGDGHESTLAWPLWDEAGFASEPVTRELLRKQNTLTGLSNEDGLALFLDELSAGADAPVVTMLGHSERRWLAARRRGASCWVTGENAVWRPDPRTDGYLDHHVLAGVPTLPGVFVTELVTTEKVRPVTFRDVRFHAPITVSARQVPTYRVVRSPSGGLSVRSDVVTPSGLVLRRDRVHAEVAEIGTGGLGVVPPHARPVRGGHAVAPSHYRSTGPVVLSGPFRSLSGVRLGVDSTTASFTPQLGAWEQRFGAFRLPVLLMDAMVQLGLITAQTVNGHDQDAPVPVGIGSIELFTTSNDVGLLDAYGRDVLVCADDEGVHALAPDGTVLVRMNGLEWTTSGRLTAASAAGR